MKYNSRLKTTLIMLTLLMSSPAHSEDMACSSSGDAIQCFESHRSAIKENSPKLAEYYSKNMNELWIERILKHLDNEHMFSVSIEALVFRARSIEIICTAHEYRESKDDDGNVVLSVIYSKADGEGPFEYKITYVTSEGFMYIDHESIDLSHKPKERYPNIKSKVIAEFCD